MRYAQRLSKASQIALLSLWSVITLFVVSDLSEYVRGDPYLMRAIPWNFVVGAILSVVILALEVVVRFARRPRVKRPPPDIANP